MSLDEQSKLNKLEELKGKLFSNSYKTKIEHMGRLSQERLAEVPDSWSEDSQASGLFGFAHNFFMKTSVFKKFFFFSLALFILATTYALYVFFVGGNTVSNDNIDISVLGNNFTAGGEDLSLVVGITNKNATALDLVDLVLEYPKGGDKDLSVGTERSRISLGTIPAGSVRNENVKLVLFGEQGSVRPIKISIEYRVEGSNAIFVKEKPYEVTISSTPISLSMDAPNTTTSNQDITLNIKASLNSTTKTSKTLLRVDYPLGFKFSSAKPAPSFGNNVWDMGDLAPGGDHTIVVVGKMVDVFNGEEKIFHVSTGLPSPTDKSAIDVVFNSLSHTVAIQKAFIEARLSVNGVSQHDYATNVRTPVYAQILWANNLDTKVDDLKITAKISGNAFDRKTVNASGGFYDSSKDIIVWDKSSNNDLAEVSPGDTGSVSFSVSPLSLFSPSAGLLANPVINIDISISGKQSVSGYATQDLNNSDSAVVHIISDVGFTSKALYFSGALKNTGPIPPKAGKETTYTVVWSLSNSANTISNAIVRSTLPSWIRYVGTIAPASEDVSYNPSTKEIVWNIGHISKGAGITGSDKVISFQVGFTPSLSQVGTTPAILNDAVLTGHDDFATVDVQVKQGGLRISLSEDAGFPSGGGVVAE